MNQEKITKFITELRKEKNLTQQEFADILGVTNSAVSKWESGKCLPDPTLYEAIAKTFDVSISELLNGKREDKNKKKNILIWIIIFLVILNMISIVEYYKTIKEKTYTYKLRVSNDNIKLTGVLIYNKKESYILISDLSIPSINEGTTENNINDLKIYLKSDNHIIMKLEDNFNDSNNSHLLDNNFMKEKDLNPGNLTIEYYYIDGLKEVHDKTKVGIINLDNN